MTNQLRINESRLLELIEPIKAGGEVETLDDEGSRVRIKVKPVEREAIIWE